MSKPDCQLFNKIKLYDKSRKEICKSGQEYPGRKTIKLNKPYCFHLLRLVLFCEFSTISTKDKGLDCQTKLRFFPARCCLF